MGQTLSLPPFFPSLHWYAAWCEALASGLDDEAAIIAANRSAAISPREYARCAIQTPGHAPQTLSIAVEGGARSLRHPGSPEIARLSSHGAWPRVHLGAIEALYGKFPYFIHFFPYIKEVYEKPFSTLKGFNTAIHGVVTAFIGKQEIQSIASSAATHRAAADRGKELLELCSADTPVIDALMKHGKETLLAIAAIKS